MKQKITSIGTMAVGILLAAGPQLLFCPCPTAEKVMKCFYSCRALIALGVILLLIGVLEFAAKGAEARCLLAAAGIAVCIFSILIPTVLIGACMKAEMTCRLVTFPITHALSTAGIVLQTVNLFTENKKRQNP